MFIVKQLTQSKNLLSIFFLVGVTELTACSSLQISEQEDASVAAQTEVVEAANVADPADPYEGFNRTMYGFNEALDTYFSEPIISGYKWISPEIVQTGVSNVFSNMDEINVVLNDMLQGKLQQGAEDTGRFLLNTTVGLVGLFDVANYVGLEKNNEDFGQTLAVWGVPAGPYLVLPVLGPATTRGIPGAAVDTLANPVSYLGWPVAVMAAVDKRATADDSLKFIDEAAVDPYVFTRESYLQWRKYLADDGKQLASDDLFYDDEFPEDMESSDAEAAVLVKQDTLAEPETKSSYLVEAEQSKPIQSAKPDSKKTAAPIIEQSEEMKAYEKAAKAYEMAQKEYQAADADLEILRNKGSKYMQNNPK